jgi:hypothetical protein
MLREANIIDLLNIHRDLFQSLALIREGGGRDLVEAEEEIETLIAVLTCFTSC